MSTNYQTCLPSDKRLGSVLPAQQEANVVRGDHSSHARNGKRVSRKVLQRDAFTSVLINEPVPVPEYVADVIAAKPFGTPSSYTTDEPSFPHAEIDRGHGPITTPLSRLSADEKLYLSLNARHATYSVINDCELINSGLSAKIYSWMTTPTMMVGPENWFVPLIAGHYLATVMLSLVTIPTIFAMFYCNFFGRILTSILYAAQLTILVCSIYNTNCKLAFGYYLRHFMVAQALLFFMQLGLLFGSLDVGITANVHYFSPTTFAILCTWCAFVYYDTTSILSVCYTLLSIAIVYSIAYGLSFISPPASVWGDALVFAMFVVFSYANGGFFWVMAAFAVNSQIVSARRDEVYVHPVISTTPSPTVQLATWFQIATCIFVILFCLSHLVTIFYRVFRTTAYTCSRFVKMGIDICKKAEHSVSHRRPFNLFNDQEAEGIAPKWIDDFLKRQLITMCVNPTANESKLADEDTSQEVVESAHLTMLNDIIRGDNLWTVLLQCLLSYDNNMTTTSFMFRTLTSIQLMLKTKTGRAVNDAFLLLLKRWQEVGISETSFPDTPDPQRAEASGSWTTLVRTSLTSLEQVYCHSSFRHLTAFLCGMTAIGLLDCKPLVNSTVFKCFVDDSEIIFRKQSTALQGMWEATRYFLLRGADALDNCSLSVFFQDEESQFSAVYVQVLQGIPHLKTGDIESAIGMTLPAYGTILDDAIKRAEMLVKRHSSTNIMYANSLMEKLRQLYEWKGIFTREYLKTRPRQEAFVFLLFGPAGQGKTRVADVLARHYLARLGVDHCADKIANINPDSKFWSGMHNGVECVKLDDIGNGNVLPGTEDPPTKKIIVLGNTNREPLPMAEAQDKDKIFCNARLGVITTNVFDAAGSVYSKKPDSIYRRMHLCMEVTANKRYCDVQYSSDGTCTTVVNSELVKTLEAPSAFGLIEDIYHISFYRPVEGTVANAPRKVYMTELTYYDKDGQAVTVPLKREMTLTEALPIMDHYFDYKTRCFNEEYVKSCNKCRVTTCLKCGYTENYCKCCDAGQQAEAKTIGEAYAMIVEDASGKLIGVCEKALDRWTGSILYPLFKWIKTMGALLWFFRLPGLKDIAVYKLLMRCKLYDGSYLEWYQRWLMNFYDLSISSTIFLFLVALVAIVVDLPVPMLVPWITFPYVCGGLLWPLLRDKYRALWTITLITGLLVECGTVTLAFRSFSYLQGWESAWLGTLSYLSTFWMPSRIIGVFLMLHCLIDVASNMAVLVYIMDRVSGSTFGALVSTSRGHVIAMTIGPVLSSIMSVAAGTALMVALKTIVSSLVGGQQAQALCYSDPKQQRLALMSGAAEVNVSSFANTNFVSQTSVSASSHMGALEKKVRANIWNAKLQIGQCQVLQLDANYCVFPAHCVKRAMSDGRLTGSLYHYASNDKVPHVKAFNVPISASHVYFVPLEDIAIVHIDGLPSRPSLTGFLPVSYESLRPTTGSYQLMTPNGPLASRVDITSYVRKLSHSQAATFTGGIATVEIATEQGFCGAPYISRSPTPIICGIHVSSCGGYKSQFNVLTASMFAEANKVLSSNNQLILPAMDFVGLAPVVGGIAMKYKNEDPHPQNWINGIDPALVTPNVLGVRESHSTPTVKVKQSPLHDAAAEVLPKEDFKVLQKPTASRRKTARKFTTMSGGQYCKVGTHIVEAAIEDYLRDLLPMCDVYEGPRAPLSIDEVINGVPGMKSFKHMNFNTSAGTPYNTRKRNVMIQDLASGRWSLRDEDLEDVNKILHQWEQSIDERVPAVSHFKSEPVGVGTDKLRMFSAFPMASFIASAKYAAPIAEFLKVFPKEAECALGIDPLGPKWHDMMQHVFKLQNKIFFDYKSYDMTQDHKLKRASVVVLLRLAERLGYSEQELHLLRCACESYLYPVLEIQGTVVGFENMNPSGQIMTSCLNSILNSIAVRCCVFEYRINHGMDLINFRQHYHLCTLGDDGASTTDLPHPTMREMETIFLETLGLEITSAVKGAELGDFATTREEQVFLKRLCGTCEGIPWVVGKLDLQSVNKALAWDNNGTVGEAQELRLIETMRCMLPEIAAHGRETFDNYCSMYKMIFERSGREYPLFLNSRFEDVIATIVARDRGESEFLDDWQIAEGTNTAKALFEFTERELGHNRRKEFDLVVDPENILDRRRFKSIEERILRHIVYISDEPSHYPLARLPLEVMLWDAEERYQVKLRRLSIEERKYLRYLQIMRVAVDRLVPTFKQMNGIEVVSSNAKHYKFRDSTVKKSLITIVEAHANDEYNYINAGCNGIIATWPESDELYNVMVDRMLNIPSMWSGATKDPRHLITELFDDFDLVGEQIAESQGAEVGDTVKIHTESEPTSVSTDSSEDETMFAALDDSNPLAGFVSRPIRIKEYGFPPGQYLNFNFDPWALILNNPRIANRITNSFLMRGTVVLHFLISANSMMYGKLMATCFMHETWDQTYSTLGRNDRGDFVLKSQRPHVFLDQNNREAEMRINFVYHRNMISLVDGDWTNLCRISIDTFVPFTHAMGAADVVTMTILAHIEDCQLSIPTTVGIHGLTQQAQGGEYGPISGPATAVAKVAGTLRSMGVFPTYARATEMVATALGKTAELFGFSRPALLDHVSNIPTMPHFSAGIGKMVANTLALDPQQGRPIDPSIFGVSTEDELLIQAIARRRVYLDQFTFSVSDAIDKLLWIARVTPCQVVNVGDGLAFTPSAWLAALFTYWSGSTKFIFEVTGSTFHKGTLRIQWDPVKIVFGEEFNLLHTILLDVSGESTHEVEIGWGQQDSYLPVERDYRKATNNTYANPPDTGFGSVDPHSNGVIGVSVVNELVSASPDAAASDTITISVFMEMCEDFSLIVPDNHYVQQMVPMRRSTPAPHTLRPTGPPTAPVATVPHAAPVPSTAFPSMLPVANRDIPSLSVEPSGPTGTPTFRPSQSSAPSRSARPSAHTGQPSMTSFPSAMPVVTGHTNGPTQYPVHLGTPEPSSSPTDITDLLGMDRYRFHTEPGHLTFVPAEVSQLRGATTNWALNSDGVLAVNFTTTNYGMTVPYYYNASAGLTLTSFHVWGIFPHNCTINGQTVTGQTGVVQTIVLPCTGYSGGWSLQPVNLAYPSANAGHQLFGFSVQLPLGVGLVFTKGDGLSHNFTTPTSSPLALSSVSPVQYGIGVIGYGTVVVNGTSHTFGGSTSFALGYNISATSVTATWSSGSGCRGFVYLYNYITNPDGYSIAEGSTQLLGTKISAANELVFAGESVTSLRLLLRRFSLYNIITNPTTLTGTIYPPFLSDNSMIGWISRAYLCASGGFRWQYVCMSDVATQITTMSAGTDTNIASLSDAYRQGFEMSHTSISPVLSVEYPFQLPYRYYNPRSGSAVIALPVRFWQVVSISTNATALVLGATAEDFTLAGFIGCPLMSYPDPSLPVGINTSGPVSMF